VQSFKSDAAFSDFFPLHHDSSERSMPPGIDTETMSFDALPEDVAVLVFSFLQPKEALAVARTCKRFLGIVRDPRLWRTYAALDDFGEELPRTVADADTRKLYEQLSTLWDPNHKLVNVLRDGVAMSSCDDFAQQSINVRPTLSLSLPFLFVTLHALYVMCV